MTTATATPPGTSTRRPLLSGWRLGAVMLIAAGVLAAVVSAVGLKVIKSVHWPAFPSSNVSYALTTAGQVVAIAILLAAVVLYRTGRYPKAVNPLAWLGISAFTTVTLAMPLGATKLYLWGISVDQQFRTEYLTRLTDSWHLQDMTYKGLPPYYPAGWFWLGGRYANLTGQPGWEAFKPWSIISLAVAATIGMALWIRMLRTDRAIAAGLAVTTLTIMQAGDEPYGACLILVGVPMLIVMLHGLRSGSIPAIVASGLFLGVSACFYTLFIGLFALTAVLMALYLAGQAWISLSNKAIENLGRKRQLTRIALRLIGMAAVSGALALIVWAPYLWHRLRGSAASGGTAEHYLPARGATLPLPMFHWSLIGALTFVGLCWLIMRFRQRTVALALGITLVACYLFCILSMIATAGGSTLLAFRLEPVIIAILGAAGVFGFAELAVAAVARFGDMRLLIGVLGAAGAIAVAQGIPAHLHDEITLAYTDTDGYGVRADDREPGAEAYFPKIDREILMQTHRPRHDSVVLTTDGGFLSLYPYWGFQGITSHYSNPLAQYDLRAAAIERWSKATSAQDLLHQLNIARWTPPNVFLFRQSADGYTMQLAKDVYPNDPNVKRYTVTFPASLFDDPQFTKTTIGPFVLIVRK
jgi:galactan 5-O-arabinofuranosyltransferase